ncbi:RidA family protein [Streptomyces sp. NPDC101150]|uniref:RidA family protein n=1 Tax=Streptomyces sp. NPDC101150 TaxID=3366114 RepID=UPI003815D18D
MEAHFTAIDPPGPGTGGPRYSQAALVPLDHTRSLMFISGQVASGEEGARAAADTAAQTEVVFDRLERLLHKEGGSLGDLVSVVIYVLDRADLPDVTAIRDRRLADPPPTSTLLQVSGLARPDFRVEISGVALVSHAT